MSSAEPRFKRLPFVAVAAAALAVAGCGGGSGSSHGNAGTTKSTSGGSGFVAQANAACAEQSSAYGGALAAIGASYKPFTQPWAAGEAAGVATATRQELTALHALTPPTAKAAEFKGFVQAKLAMVPIERQEQAAATRSDLSTFKALDARRNALAAAADKIAGRIGLGACAQHGLSSSEIAQIKHVISYSATTSAPAACTQLETKAFVVQLYGSVAKCVQEQEHPSSPNPKSATVAHVTGAGDFATAEATLQLPNGRTVRYATAVYRQGGQWRMLGLRAL